MIQIRYNPDKLEEYNIFIDNFISNLDTKLKKFKFSEESKKSKKRSKKEKANLKIKVSKIKKYCDQFKVDLGEEEGSALGEEYKASFKGLSDRLSNDSYLSTSVALTDYKTVRFFHKVKQELKNWINYSPSQINELVIEINRDYPEFSDNESILKKVAIDLFVNKGYSSKNFPSAALINAIEISVCPYCNRIFIKNVVGKDNKNIRGQLDHFYDKATYPYLALLKNNLIPCCSYCNGPTGKHTKDAIEEHLVSPLELEDNNSIKFHIIVEDSDLLDINNCAKSLKVEIEYNNPKMKNNSRIFHLEELYQTHSNYAAEMYYKHKIFCSEAYKAFLSSLNLEFSEDDWNRLIYGISRHDEDLGNKPLDKFCLDILNQLEE